MKIKFIKNIAVIIIDIDHKPTDKDYQTIIDTVQLDCPYKIHILVEEPKYPPSRCFDNLYDYIELINLPNKNSRIFVHYNAWGWLDSSMIAGFKDAGIRFDRIEDLTIGTFKYKKQIEKKSDKRYYRYYCIVPLKTLIKSLPEFNN